MSTRGSPGLRDVDLTESTWYDVDLSRSTFRAVAFRDVVMRGAEFNRAEIHGDVEDLTINGVDVGPLITAAVRRVVDELTGESIAAGTKPVEGGGWPPADNYPVRECLLIVLNEEWEHRLYAERDLEHLEDAAAAADRRLP